ncbi:hypothetical protein MNO14_06245 [Luteimonas sp. S4-F44]|uniref:hypothetical protein n=1 Tax=Luteimonas sp. S4-F44 TaxID=2925842 RepID=UPI001F53C472|nr:hypothetical protein [Luteimonas sp. S4-F44]UNK43666.1 hypothetical protein MNO14_06245 [Luteimonas sp. S4-F44]
METAAARAQPAQLDWSRLASCHRSETPGLFRVVAPWSADAAYRLAIAICRPSRAGIRFFTLPAVRFFVGQAEIRAPGALLPDERDVSGEDYLRRLQAWAPDEAVSLEIEAPLIADVAAWMRVRNFLWAWCAHLGCPARPIVAHLLLGRYRREAIAHRDAALIFPLSGQVALTCARSGHQVAVAGAGALLYRPCGEAWQETGDAGCIALRLTMPRHRVGATRELLDLFASLVPTERPDGDAVPSLPVRGTGADGALELPAMLARNADALGAWVAGASADLADSVHRLARASACALEPVPGRLASPTLASGDRVRTVPGARILEVPAGAGARLWAVNGHTLAVDDTPASGALRETLARGGAWSVDALCGADAVLRTVLAQLQSVRGVVPDGPAAVGNRDGEP